LTVFSGTVIEASVSALSAIYSLLSAPLLCERRITPGLQKFGN
jgi:hypothetical protein